MHGNAISASPHQFVFDCENDCFSCHTGLDIPEELWGNLCEALPPLHRFEMQMTGMDDQNDEDA
jgi:hypothetical protein